MQQNNYLKITDSSYRVNQSAGYHLNVCLRANGFSYNVFNPEKQRHIALFDVTSENKEFNIENYLDEDELLNQSFGKIRVAFSSSNQVLIPQKLYAEKSQAKLTENIFGSQPDFFTCNLIKPLNAYLISGIDKGLQSIIDQHFTGSSLFHEGVPFMQGLLNDFAESSSPLLGLNIQDDYLELICLKDGKLQLYNRYPYSNNEQLVYFPLLVCQQLEIDPHKVNTLLYGSIDAASEKYQAIANYFRYADFGELTDDELKYSKQMAHLPQHRYYSLFNMELCG